MPYVFLGIFFLSGFAALLYQTIWQRMLTLFGGADVSSATVVVGAFMAGLGLGHLAGGGLADRLNGRSRLMAFACCEFAIAAFAAWSPWLYYDALYRGIGLHIQSRAGLAAIVFLVTLWPTFFMGMSLPIASRVLTDEAGDPARWVPRLYGWNTAGAACGSLITVAVVLRVMGFPGALRLGAILSLSCGAVALWWWHHQGPARDRTTRHAAPPAPPQSPGSPSRPSGLKISQWTATYALSGFIALSLEIIWFRVLGIAIKSSAYTFGHLLAIYLAGVGAGALVANTRRFARLAPVPTFFLLQAAVPIIAALCMSLFIGTVGRVGWLQPLFSYLGSYDSLGFAGYRRPMFYVLYGVLPVFLVGPATLLMGMSFSMLQRAVQTDVMRLGRRVGWLQAANITGALGGALLTGVVLLDVVGSPGTLQLLAAIGAAFIWWFVRDGRWRTAAGLALVAFVAIVTMPRAGVFWARLHGTTAGTILFAEDASGVSVLRRDVRAPTRVFVNGLGQSWLPYGGLHTALGALPALIHPNPRRIAVIGLGSGDTLFAASGREETTTIDVIETIAPQLTTLRSLHAIEPYAGLARILGDPRIAYHFGDGRMFLGRSQDRYDVIEADALRPTSAYAGNLYSVEYFALLCDRLRPGGLAVSWSPTRRVVNSMRQAFPYLATFGDISVGSQSPIQIDPAAVLARARTASTLAHFDAAGIDIVALIEDWLSREPELFGPDADRLPLDVNRDLFPRDEFGVRRRE